MKLKKPSSEEKRAVAAVDLKTAPQTAKENKKQYRRHPAVLEDNFSDWKIDI